jgi:outer membrane protein
MPARIPRPERAAPQSLPLAGLLSACLGLLFMAHDARAQSLIEVYDAARSYDATYLAARALADSAKYRAEQAYALRRPTVSINASSARNEIDPPTGPDRDSTTNQATLQGRQPLYNRANSATIDQAERQLEIAMADLQTAEQDLIVRVAQAYFDVLTARETLNTARANKAAIAEQLASAKRNFEVGTTTITDTREAQARHDLALSQEIAAENDLLTRQIALDQLVGRTGVSPIGLGPASVLPQVSPPDAEGWVSYTEESPAVRKARLGLDVAQLETDKANAGHLPTLDLVGSYGKTRNNGVSVTSSGSIQVPGTFTNATVGVQLNVPLFAGFAVQNRVKETVALEERSRNELEAARRSVAQSTRQVFYGVQSGQAQVKALEAAEASSKLALEATQLGYKVGVRVNIDVLNAQTQLFTTQRDLASARYAVLLNGLRLRQVAGQLKPEDLVPLNSLLSAK